MYITGPCAPERPSGKILTYAEVLVYAYITVKFQLRSSINMPLTESSIWIGLHWKVPQNGVLRRILGVGAKIFGGNPLRMQRLPIYAFSFNAGTWRIDGRTDSIAICIHVILNFFLWSMTLPGGCSGPVGRVSHLRVRYSTKRLSVRLTPGPLQATLSKPTACSGQLSLLPSTGRHIATGTGWRPSVADWGDGVSASCTVGPIVR